jgi:hypothetical protein
LQKLKINPEQIEEDLTIPVRGLDDILAYVNSSSYSKELIPLMLMDVSMIEK